MEFTVYDHFFHQDRCTLYSLLEGVLCLRTNLFLKVEQTLPAIMQLEEEELVGSKYERPANFHKWVMVACRYFFLMYLINVYIYQVYWIWTRENKLWNKLMKLYIIRSPKLLESFLHYFKWRLVKCNAFTLEMKGRCMIHNLKNAKYIFLNK